LTNGDDETGRILYQVNEPFGSYGDIFWAPAKAFRPLTEDEISPISPDVEEKRVEVNIPRQTLSCFEGRKEVYFCRISSGALWNAWVMQSMPGQHLWGNTQLAETHLSPHERGIYRGRLGSTCHCLDIAIRREWCCNSFYVLA
jgi:hypothetical protein